jgi:hypothetical protein
MIWIRPPLSLCRARSCACHWGVPRTIGIRTTVTVTSCATRCWRWCCSGKLLCVLLLLATAAVGAPATAENEKNNEAANTGRKTNDEWQMAVDPALDFLADGAVGTLTLCAVSVDLGEE